jgi:hypothetical protein
MARQWIPCCGSRRLRHWIILLFAIWLATFASSGSARANIVVDVNNALLNIIQNISAALVDGPETAREIALIDGAMFDAVNAASGNPYPPIAYYGGPVSGADPNAAALQAALTVMNSLYGPSSLYQQYEGVTGATLLPFDPGLRGCLGRADGHPDERSRRADQHDQCRTRGAQSRPLLDLPRRGRRQRDACGRRQ